MSKCCQNVEILPNRRRIVEFMSSCYWIFVDTSIYCRNFCKIAELLSNCGIIVDDYLHTRVDTTIDYELVETW